jgi:hypothetical protein
MNEKIKELAEQAGLYVGVRVAHAIELERFAELVRQEEREKCAKLCENVVSNEGYVQSEWCAQAIRGRTE